MSKKAICFLAALMLCVCCAGAPAEEAGRVYDMPSIGMRFEFPPEYENAKGYIGTDGVLELDGANYYMYLFYCAVPKADFNRMYAENPGEASARASVLFYAFAVGEGKDFSEVVKLTGGSMTAEGAMEMGKEGDYTFYLYPIEDAGFAASLDGDYRGEYAALCAMKDRVAASFACYAPVNEYTGLLDGSVIRFTAKDLDGNPVSSDELFSRHAVTFVNIWATWCGPCVGELKELQAIHTRFLDKDCAVVGLLTDSDIDEARRLMEANGITYDVVLISSDFTFALPYSGIPTSFFVDRNGAFLGTKFVGASPELYEPALEPFLEK
ncbi:MAG: TlpA family protein disulfide reductase [Clostridia bacterium]|nr:TlpA family protein disulfide reductase [Clostridia bacterium]